MPSDFYAFTAGPTAQDVALRRLVEQDDRRRREEVLAAVKLFDAAHLTAEEVAILDRGGRNMAAHLPRGDARLHDLARRREALAKPLYNLRGDAEKELLAAADAEEARWAPGGGMPDRINLLRTSYHIWCQAAWSNARGAAQMARGCVDADARCRAALAKFQDDLQVAAAAWKEELEERARWGRLSEEAKRAERAAYREQLLAESRARAAAAGY